MKKPHQILTEALQAERRFVNQWRRPSDVTLLETVRAIDNLFMVDLFPSDTPSKDDADKQYWTLATWGVNQALSRVMPGTLIHGPFRHFQSIPKNQQLADDLLFHGGVLETAEMLHEWLADGLLEARVDTVPPLPNSGVDKILVLKTRNETLFGEMISIAHRKWRSGIIMQSTREAEAALEQDHLEIIPELDKHLRPSGSWGMEYTTTPEIDRHFHQWAHLYLQRIWGADIIGSEERIGGHTFGNYLEIITALSARCQKHLAFCWRAKQHNPTLDYRNLLTSFSGTNEFLFQLAAYLDADSLQIQKLLSSLTLEPANSAVHLGRRETAWAPLIRASADFYILPVYGLDINPYLFLMQDLAAKYQDDWSRVANGREKRWQEELNQQFQSPRWKVALKGMKLREGSTVITDIDFAAFDTSSNEIALFQLKWQQPVGHGASGRARRSAGSNFVVECEKWIGTVLQWLDRHGVDELMGRLDFKAAATPKVSLFVLGRYNAHYSGYSHDGGPAAWGDWAHFQRLIHEFPSASPSILAEKLIDDTKRLSEEVAHEGYMLPLQELAVIVNPTSDPGSGMR